MYSNLISYLEYDNKEKRYKNLNPEILEDIGFGKRGSVFKVKGENKVIKMFSPNKEKEALQERNAYLQIKEDNPYFVKIHDYGDLYIIIDYIEGKTLYELMTSGYRISYDIISEIDKALDYARSIGLNPSDVHFKNIIINENKIKIVDLERFLQKEFCKRWDHFKLFYHTLYSRPFFPKKIPLWLIETTTETYRKIDHMKKNFLNI